MLSSLFSRAARASRRVGCPQYSRPSYHSIPSMFTVERSLPLSRELPSWQSSDRFSRDDVQSDVARLLVAADRTRIEQPATPADMPLSVRESVTRRILI